MLDATNLIELLRREAEGLLHSATEWDNGNDILGGPDFRASSIRFTEAVALIEQQARDIAALQSDIEAQIRIASEEAARAANWKRMLQAVTSEIDDREYSEPWRRTENAPGHGHEKPGVWDWDNGKKAGKPCAWCLVWNEARAALANKDG